MKVRVEIGGILRKPGGQSQLDLELPEGARPEQLFGALGYSETEQRALRVSRAGAILRPSQDLAEGDHLLVFAAVGGG